VVDVAVGQHDPVDAWRRGQDLGARSRRAGVDQRDGIAVTPNVDLPAVHPLHGQVSCDG
jgi:hypothetical protein